MLTDIGHSADRLFAEFLFIVDIASGGVEFVIAEQELNVFERRMGVVVDACAGPAGIMGAKFAWPTRAA